MANIDNLKQGNPTTQYGSCGRNAVEDAYKSHESRRRKTAQRKLAKDLMIALLNTNVSKGESEDIESIDSIYDLDGKNATALAKGLAELAKGVAEGDRKDIELALKIAGEWVEKSESTIMDSTSEAYEDYVREKKDS